MNLLVPFNAIWNFVWDPRQTQNAIITIGLLISIQPVILQQKFSNHFFFNNCKSCTKINLITSMLSQRRFPELENMHSNFYCLSGCSCGVALINASFFSNCSMILWIIGNCSRSTLNLASKTIILSIGTKLVIKGG